MANATTEATLLVGPPKSGKTTELRRRLQLDLEAGLRVVLLTSVYDGISLTDRLGIETIPSNLMALPVTPSSPNAVIAAGLTNQQVDAIYMDGALADPVGLAEGLRWIRSTFPAARITIAVQTASDPSTPNPNLDALGSALAWDHVVQLPRPNP